MDIDLNKFVDDLDKHLKTLKIPEGHIKRLCGILGEVKVSVELKESNSKKTITTKSIPLRCLASVEVLEETMKNIIGGSRADMIYAYEDFVRHFFKEQEEKRNG